MCCLAHSVAAQLQTPPPDCAHPPAYDFVIGNPSTVTNYVGNYTFNLGSYHVVGDLHFSAGTFFIKPGTRFYVDGKVVTFKNRLVIGGYSLTLGDGARIEAEGALFTAACNTNLLPAQSSMWKGILFEPDRNGQSLHLSNGCRVAYAQYGVYVPYPYAGMYSYYNVSNTRFEQNLYHIYDLGRHNNGTSVPPCLLENLTLLSQPNLLSPYQANPDESWTYEALHLTPVGKVDGSPEIIVSGTNTIQGAICGLVANMPGQGELRFDDRLNVQRIARIGIWLDETTSLLSFPAQTTIDLNNGFTTPRAYRTRFMLATDPQYGLVGASNNPPAYLGAISVTGRAGSDTTNYKTQTGVYFAQSYQNITNLSLNNLTFGLSLREGGNSVHGNTFSGCWHGLRLQANAGYTVGFDAVCNTFVASNAGTSSAILVDANAQLSQQGGPGNPQGNKFTGYASGQNSVMNRGPGFLNYYRYIGSVDEEATAVTDGINPMPTGLVNSTTSPSYPLANFCQSRGLVTGVQSRGTSQATRMQALMDTLRRRAAPVARLMAYQLAIRQWLLVAQPDTAALETYVGTLFASNPEAFFGLGLDLLEQYRRVGRRAAAARLRPVLAARVAGHPAAAARLALSDVVSRLSSLAPWPMRQVPAADSIVLRRVARTPGGAAEMAALWFNYLYPGAGLRPAVLRPGGTAGAKPIQPLSQAVVRALYPNPAADRLHVEINAPVGAKSVVLRLTELLGGRVVSQTTIPVAKNGTSQAVIDVHDLRTGQYAAMLTIDGVPATTQKVLISR